ncbi:MAG: hypothetical protein ACI8RZ_001804 [Myxococcota bacterium]|jgi:hypothetical protein
MVTIVDDFLPSAEFTRIRQLTRPRRGGRDVYSQLPDVPFLDPLQSAITARFPVVDGLSIQHILLRFEGQTGLLHHDLNGRPHRRFSLLFYIDVPTEGGQLIFPFFDDLGIPTDNPVTEACCLLHADGRLYSKDPALETYMIAHQDTLLTVPPRPNTAVFFASDDPATWHFACPVGAGERSCLVFFYQGLSALDAPGRHANMLLPENPNRS